jgi:light-regulated signal transduction histidine kinase (bacteriophytochrome)
LIGKTDFDTYPDALAHAAHKDEQEIIRTGESVVNKIETAELADGRVLWWLVTKLPWRDKDGKTIGTFGASQDVTPLKQAEESLRKSTAQLERSNRELQDFAYVASHDLQEPLRKIVVFGERLQEKAAERLEPETLDYLQRMRKAASRMQTLINDLLAFSRVTTKALPFTQVNLAQTAREVIEDLEGRIEMTKGRIEQGELPVIDAEPVQMRQLIQNLLGNALKFRRPEVPPVVKIEAKVYSGAVPQAPPGTPDQTWCELTVSDNGIGFDEKYLDRIFNVFQRLHTRNEYEGTGMGLAIARKIVLLHGGFITARSAPGKGAAFIATLPVSHPKSNSDGI